MIDFIIVGLPRCGTTWAANWLTTDQAHCFHDPLYTKHYSEWDSMAIPGRLTGVSCTGIWRWPDWLNAHPARKIILHRDLAEINASLEQIGLPAVGPADERQLASIIGMHVPFEDLFSIAGAEAIWDFATGGLPVNRERHEELRLIEMQPQFSGLSVGREVTRRLREELLDF